MISESKILEGYKILVAEDDLNIQAFMKTILERYGATVTIASDGSEACEVLLHEKFDVALMDIEMPVCNGFEAAGRIRAAGYIEPIVAISSRYIDKDFKHPFANCFNEKLSKPVNLPILIDMIKNMSRESRKKKRDVVQDHQSMQKLFN